MPPQKTELAVREVFIDAERTFDTEADARSAFDELQKVVTGTDFPLPLQGPQEEVFIGFGGEEHDHTNRGSVAIEKNEIRLSAEFSGQAQPVFEQAIDLVLDEIGYLTIGHFGARCVLTTSFDSLEGLSVESEFGVKGVTLVENGKELNFEANGGETVIRVVQDEPVSTQAPVSDEITQELEEVIEVVSAVAPGRAAGSEGQSRL